jgi:hypothetical protein
VRLLISLKLSGCKIGQLKQASREAEARINGLTVVLNPIERSPASLPLTPAPTMTCFPLMATISSGPVHDRRERNPLSANTAPTPAAPAKNPFGARGEINSQRLQMGLVGKASHTVPKWGSWEFHPHRPHLGTVKTVGSAWSRYARAAMGGPGYRRCRFP